MCGKNLIFKSGKTLLLQWDFCQSRISTGFGKSAGFRPEPKSGTTVLGIAIKHPVSDRVKCHL